MLWAIVEGGLWEYVFWKEVVSYRYVGLGVLSFERKLWLKV